MVPSRSRKTAGRSAMVSSRTRLHRRNPLPRGCFDSVRLNPRHTPVIGRAATQKTWAAVWFFLNDAAAWRDWCGPERIGGPKHGDDGEAYGGGDVHRAGVVPNEQVAFRKKRG